MALQVTQAYQNFLKTVQLVQRNMSDVDLLGLETKDNELVIKAVILELNEKLSRLDHTN